jgi:NAD(P)-dependent dehydrogenase (short-subunit alcohol dehydrogenase family)
MGATVVLVCRDEERGKEAVEAIKAASGHQAVDLMLADLSSQASICRVAEEFTKRHDRLHVLVNNAGVIKRDLALTEDGLEMTFAVNYLAPFLLTSLLLDVLKASAPARIVNVCSVVHRVGKIDFGNLKGEKGFGTARAYARSKLADVLFTYELARRLDGTKVTVNGLDPGMVATDLGHEYTGLMRLFVMKFLRLFEKSAEKGAATSIYLASSPEVEGVTGKYFSSRRRPVKTSKASHDTKLAEQLWEVSTELTKLPSQQSCPGLI